MRTRSFSAIIYQLVTSSIKEEPPPSASPSSDVLSPAASISPSPCPSAESAAEIGCLKFLSNSEMRYQFHKSNHLTVVGYQYFWYTLQ